MTPVKRGTIYPQAHQLAMIADRPRYRIRAVQGGYRSGKSWGGAAALIEQGLASGLPQMMCGPSHRVLEDVLVETTRGLCDSAGLPCDYRKSDRQLVIGRRRPFLVYLRSAEQAVSAMQAITVAGAWGDEWEFWPLDVLKAFLARVSIGDRSIVLTSTAEGFNKNWELLLKDPAPTTKTYVWPTRLNEEISPEYIADMRDRFGDETEAAEKLEGVRAAMGGRVYTRFDRSVHCGPPCVQPGMGEIQIACDFNVFGMHWLVVEVSHGGRRVHVIGEVVGSPKTPTTTDEHAIKTIDYITALLNERGQRVTRREVVEMQIKAFCDASGSNRSAVTAQTHVTLLHQAGFRPMHGAANPPVVDRVNDVQVMLRDVRLTVDADKAPGLVSTFEQQPYDGDVPSKKEGLDHAADAIGYLIHWQFPTERPKPNAPLTGRALRVAERYASRTSPRGGLE